MTRLEYILLIMSKALERGVMPQREAAKLLDRCLTVAHTAPEPEDNVDFSKLHALVSRKYSHVMGWKPFNPAFHAHAISLGYTHVRLDADWEETGTGETGPMLRGHPASDEYLGADEVIYISENGEADYREIVEEEVQ